jgi:hypothetical protein
MQRGARDVLSEPSSRNTGIRVGPRETCRTGGAVPLSGVEACAISERPRKRPAKSQLKGGSKGEKFTREGSRR